MSDTRVKWQKVPIMHCIAMVGSSQVDVYLTYQCMRFREAFKKKNHFFCDKCHTCSTPPPKCDEKPFAFYGQKWPFQEVKIFDVNHAICQSLQSSFENFLTKISMSQPKTANSPPFRA